jgi:uncharacterized protein YaiE (UPF0345 family)
MTESEFYSLSKSLRYAFYLYHKEAPLFGICKKIITEDCYVIVEPNQQNEWEKYGTVVTLEMIAMYEPISKMSYQPPSYKSFQLPNKKAKKMVIFGAGASCQYSYNMESGDYNPPLTKDIFQLPYTETLKDFPGAHTLASEIKLHTNSLEEYFEKQWKRVSENYDPLLMEKLISCQYYIANLFLSISSICSGSDTSNYYNIVKQAREYADSNGELVIFVNFNYDLLLEEALIADARYNFDTIDSYIDWKQGNLLYFKPHGSCNWGRFIDTKKLNIPGNSEFNRFSFIQFAHYLYDRKMLPYEFSEYFKEEINIISSKIVTNNLLVESSDLYMPQLLIPYKNKDEFVMPEAHLQMLNSVLPHIEEILIIGWKGTESKFQSLIKNHLEGKKIKITAVTGGSEYVKKSFKESLPLMTKQDWKFYKQGFTEYIKKLDPFFT